MEINEISLSVNKALSALEQMQRMTAMNIANANLGVKGKYHFDIGALLANVNQAPNALTGAESMQLVKQLAERHTESVMLDQEVMTSAQISGKFKAIVEGYNKQMGLYQLALGKGR